MIDENSDIPFQIQVADYYQKQLEDRTLSPFYVQWIATHKCNFRCPHCGTAADEARPDELTTDQILNVLEQLKDLGTQVFSLTGGEAILRDDFLTVMKKCKELDIKAGFVTNGFEIEKYRDMIAEAEPFSVMVSIDGYGKNHDKIRGVDGAYERAMNALEILRDMKIPVISTATVYMEDNIDDIEKIFHDCIKHGSMRHRIQTIVPEGRAVGRANDPEIMKKALKTIIQMKNEGHNIEVCEGHGYMGPLDGVVRSKFFCACGWSTFTIMSNGDVQGCPALEYSELSEANVKDTPIADIWWNKFERFRETYFDDMPDDCKECDDVEVCRGACWLQRVNGDYCFIEVAKEVAEELGIKK